MYTSVVPVGAADLASDDVLVETARVTRSDRGVRASGYLVRSTEDPEQSYGSWYEVLSDSSGALRRLTVRADAAFGERVLSLTRAPGGPWVADGSRSEPALTNSTDVVLAGSSLTLSLPAHRLGLLAGEPGSSTTVEVAVIDVPELTVSSETVTYRTLDTSSDGVTEILATSGNRENLLRIGTDGLVPGAPLASAR